MRVEELSCLHLENAPTTLLHRLCRQERCAQVRFVVKATCQFFCVCCPMKLASKHELKPNARIHTVRLHEKMRRVDICQERIGSIL